MHANRASKSKSTQSNHSANVTIKSRAQAFEALGLKSDATPERIRQRFRRLAFLYHPDRNRFQTDAAHFKRISQAYRFLNKFGATDHRNNANLEFVCKKCQNVAELHTGLDRNRYCRDCLLFIDGHRGLPAPPIVFASLGFAAAMLISSCVTLALYIWAGKPSLGWTTLLLAVISFASIAITAITIGLAARPKRDRKRRTLFK